MRKSLISLLLVAFSAPVFAQTPVDARSDEFVRQVHGANVRLGIDLVIKSVADSAKAALRAAEAAKKTAAGIRVPANLPAVVALQRAVDQYSAQVALREAGGDTLAEGYLQFRKSFGDRSLQLKRGERYFRDYESLVLAGAQALLEVQALKKRLESADTTSATPMPAAPRTTSGGRTATAAAPTTGDYITAADAKETFATKAEVKKGFEFVATGLRELEPAAKNKKTLQEAINGLIAVF